MVTDVSVKLELLKRTAGFAERKDKSVGTGYMPLFCIAKLSESIVFSGCRVFKVAGKEEAPSQQ